METTAPSVPSTDTVPHPSVVAGAQLPSSAVHAEPEFLGENLMRIGTTLFHYFNPLSTHVPDAHLSIDKTRPMLESYFDLWDELRPRRVVELGVWLGGSTAMMAELGVERLVACELSDVRVEALDRYIAEQGIDAVVHLWYGVNQADRARLTQIVAEEFGGEPLDLVVDDASHEYDESLASFEVLFPRLRPGGLYLLEDWRWSHLLAVGMNAALQEDATSEAMWEKIRQHIKAEGEPRTPMSRIVMELVLARAIEGDVVDGIAIDGDWVTVRRGPAELDPETFRLGDHGVDLFQMLSPRR